MSEVHALFAISFPVTLGEHYRETPETMRDFFEDAFMTGYELPLPVFVTDETLVKLDAFIEEHKLDG
jgi:hypothetical protein